MALTSSNSYSTISRYRPAILILTGLTVAYSIYYIHQHFFSDGDIPPSTPSYPLRRRNAIYRRPSQRQRRRQRTQGQQLQENDASTTEGETPIMFHGRTDNGEDVSMLVNSRTLPDILSLQNQYHISADAASELRNRIESVVLDNFLAQSPPPEQLLAVATNDQRLVIQMFLDRGFRVHNIREAFDRFINGSLLLSSGEAANNPERLQELRRRMEDSQHPDDSSEIPNGTSDGHVEDLVEEIHVEDTVQDQENVPNSQDHGRHPSGETVGTDAVNGGQGLLNLLYHIAAEQATREGYIHRGVTCNSCGMVPIRGIRYRCSNCLDFDLCESCETMQMHPKTHLFYKIRIPAPFLGSPRQAQPVWYPGKPGHLPRSLPLNTIKDLVKETGFERPELEALYDQFRCLANAPWPEDPLQCNMAIDRSTFDKCFIPNTGNGFAYPNLVYDRIFAFYDTDSNGLVGLHEFLTGSSCLNGKSKDERIRRTFKGYDLNEDGYVTRKDFLRMFRAYYALTKELTKEIVIPMDDENGPENMGWGRSVISTSQPLSSAFPGRFGNGEESRTGQGKQRNEAGDMELIDDEGVVLDSSDDQGEFHQVIEDVAERRRFGNITTGGLRQDMDSMFLPVSPTEIRTTREVEVILEAAERATVDTTMSMHDDSDADDEDHDHSDGEDDGSWPPQFVVPADVEIALGRDSSLDSITDLDERDKVRAAAMERIKVIEDRKRNDERETALEDRYERREFYLDEEDGVALPGGMKSDTDPHGNVPRSANDDSDDGPASRRSRSSSKVRFEDDVTDTDYETRSNHSTSSRSIPHGERWGGYGIPEAERDVGKEIVYQVTQSGLNEMLDPLFREKEDLKMECLKTRAERKKWAKEIEVFAKTKGDITYNTASIPSLAKWNETLRKEGLDNEITEVPTVASTITSRYSSEDTDKALQALLDDAGYSIINIVIDESSVVIPNSATDPLPQPTSLTPDPTLPQNRPNSPSINATPTAQVQAQPQEPPKETPSEEYRDPTLPQNRPNTPPPPSPSLKPSKLDDNLAHNRLSLLSSSNTLQQQTSERPPSQRKLERYLMMEAVEKEYAERGELWGSLSLEEFEKKMDGPDGSKLGYLGMWIDLASF
ncbi:MAG: hypothetical protein M1834_003665 [Cirrosporium novae-zelandiae]|nr:MAG: hypothetical protein M1834_003665 [Cirrosporium novae-zelandiae]